MSDARATSRGTENFLLQVDLSGTSSPSTNRNPVNRNLLYRVAEPNILEEEIDVEESDFLNSENKIRLSALQEDETDMTKEEKEITSKREEEEYDERSKDDEGDGERGEETAPTFHELFGGAYDAHLASSGLKRGDVDGESYREKQVQSIVSRLREEARKPRDMINRKLAEEMFTHLFKTQTEVGGSDLMLHAVAREGWKHMLEIHMRTGSEEELNSILDAYEVMYGLHESDRALFYLKYQLKQGHLATAMHIWRTALAEGKVDERGFSTLASTAASQGDFTAAFAFLEDAWMKALTDSSFKITRIFYKAAAVIYIQALDFNKLNDLFIRLHANIPTQIESDFFVKLFKTINKVSDALNLRPKHFDKSETSQSIDEDSSNIPNHSQTQYNEVSSNEQAKAKDLSSEEAEKAKKTEEMRNKLRAMFELVEKAMEKYSIPPGTTLRNEIIAFKLYSESSVPGMFSVISQYSTKPDETTLNIMIDALLYERKISVASSVCVAWDAQFGVKPNRSTSGLISKYMISYSQELEQMVSKESTLSGLMQDMSEVETIRGVPKLNSLFAPALVHPALELFDELVAHQSNIDLSGNAIVALGGVIMKIKAKISSTLRSQGEYLKDSGQMGEYGNLVDEKGEMKSKRTSPELEVKDKSGGYTALGIFVSYLESRPLENIPNDATTLYSVAKLLLSSRCFELGSRVVALAELRGVSNLYRLKGLELTQSSKYEHFSETRKRWYSGWEALASGDRFHLLQFLQVWLNVLVHAPLSLAHKEILVTIARISKGELPIDSHCSQNCLRLLQRLRIAAKWGHLPQEKLERPFPSTFAALFQLEKRRRDANVVLTSNYASQVAQFFSLATPYFLANLPVLEELKSFISDAPMGLYTEALSDEDAQNFIRLFDAIESICSARQMPTL